ncbi:hypothetical protein EGW08_023433 [Elysia chlorotica]|uniref:Caveolin n=1 Tax=Elysia chlorotica TaxID=188477 RepID=A0A3S1B0E3_ELYCH|nr:hypothetical protein EGW08_023433 [Elysia chlorotica]
MMSSAGVDLVMRDPNNINDHVKVCFEDVLAEPEGAHSFDCVWANSYRCFECCKNCWYKLLTLFFGICIAMYWGYEFAVITFWHVWIYTPALRVYMIECGFLQKFWHSCLQCYLRPLFEACGYCFSTIRVTNSTE